MKISTAVKTASLILGIALSIFAVSLVVFAQPWHGPRHAPPGCLTGNPGCDRPLHTGARGQNKVGNLSIEGHLHAHRNLIVGGDIGIGTAEPGTRLDVRGDVIANAFYHHSDRNLKKEIRALGNSLGRILELEGVSYKWKESGEQNIGLIAQDTEEIFPEIVFTSKEGQKAINYAKLVAPLIEAIQEQQEQIERQQREIRELRDKIEKTLNY